MSDYVRLGVHVVDGNALISGPVYEVECCDKDKDREKDAYI